MKKFLIILIVLTTSLFCYFKVKAAETNPFKENGKYQVEIDKYMTMGASNFEDYVYVEKLNDNYYLTFIVKDKESIGKVELLYGTDKIGQMYKEEGKKAFYTYTLDYQALTSKLPFKGFVNAMKMDVDWEIKLKLSSAKKLSDMLDERGERPAFYLPTIEAASGELEMQRGSYYTVLAPKAFLGGNELPLKTSVYYLKGNEKVNINLENSRFILEEIGEYHVVFEAESTLYRTSLDNPTKSVVDLKIISKANVTTLAKASNLEGKETIPLNVSVQALRISVESDKYKLVSKKLQDLSNNYELMSVNLFDLKGEEIKPSENIYLDLLVNPTYDRTKIEVYHLNSENELEEVKSAGYGRYVRVETSELGDFVILVPGVPFKMPMWGYMVITIVAVLVIATGITLPLVIHHHKQKRRK